MRTESGTPVTPGAGGAAAGATVPANRAVYLDRATAQGETGLLAIDDDDSQKLLVNAWVKSGRGQNVPVTVDSHFYDGVNDVVFDAIPDIAIDVATRLPSGMPNPNYGKIYLTWQRYYPSGRFPE